MSTPLVVALNALNVLTGGEPRLMAKHSAPETKKSQTRTQQVSERAYKVHAPKCPHGHFLHYAVKNCKKGCKIV